jgi:pentatricopeptide repeat protein
MCSAPWSPYWHVLCVSQLGNLEQALSLLRSMSSCGLVADTFSYTSAITACTQPDQCHTAIQVGATIALGIHYMYFCVYVIMR